MTESPIFYNKIIGMIEEKCNNYVKNSAVPGIAVSLFSKNKIIYLKGFGYTDKTKTKEVDENTRFAYQSTGKSIVATVTMKAVQDGLINLDDPIIDYYPEFLVQSTFERDPQKKITFRHLLSHSSGIQEGAPPGNGVDEKGESYDPTFEERIASIQGSWLRYPVGSASTYSNFGIDLVTYGLQRASGKDYPEFLKDSFGSLLGMNSIIYDRETALQDNDTAKGYLGYTEAVIRDSVAYGAGMPFISIKDLATFAQFLLNKGSLSDKRILEEKYLDEMFEGDYSQDYFGGFGARYSNYGIGIFLNNINQEIKLLHHPGGAFGYNSNLVIIPELDFGIVVMSNNEYNFPVEDFTIDVLRGFLNEKGIEVASEEVIDRREDEIIESPSDSLEKFTGWYAFVGYDNFLVQSKDKKLFLGKHELIQHTENEFSSETNPRIIFEMDSHENPQSLIYWHKDHGKFKANFVRKEEKDKKLDKEQLDEYTGLYCYYYYGIERWYFAILAKDNSLVVSYGEEETLLTQSNVQPNLFFDYKGKSYEFFTDYVLVGQIKMLRYDNPVKEIQMLSENIYKNRYLNKYNLEYIEKLLRLMNRDQEADEIKKINSS